MNALYYIIPSALALSGATYLAANRQRQLIRTARRYDLMEEIAQNGGFANNELDAQMRNIAQYNTYEQWCAHFVRLVFLQNTKDKYIEKMKYTISPATQTLWARAKADTTNLFHTTTEPQASSIVVWRNKTDSSRGHTGIVTRAYAGGFNTIEGNATEYTQYSTILGVPIFEDGTTLRSNGIVAQKQYTSGNTATHTLLGFVTVRSRAFKLF